MDTTDPGIRFDEQGSCNHCTAAIERMRTQLLPPRERELALQDLVSMIKKEGNGREYDCIIGVSGGVDSTTTAYWVKKLRLRPLAVHFDNGWDSELAVDNIKRTLDVLGIELFTHVVDWEEFRDLQLCFLKASVVNCEAPTDHGISAMLFRMASRVGTRFILSGSNLATEAIMPHAWAYFNQDLRLLKALHRRFGKMRLKTMPTISLRQYVHYVFVKRIRQIPFLNYINYDKAEAKRMLAIEAGWRDYGAKHYESVWTRYFQGFYLPNKCGYDKRRAHLSSLICSGQMTRQEAFESLKEPIYDPELLRQDSLFVLKKLGLSQKEFDVILREPVKSETDYPNNSFFFHTLEPLKNIFRKMATSP